MVLKPKEKALNDYDSIDVALGRNRGPVKQKKIFKRVNGKWVYVGREGDAAPEEVRSWADDDARFSGVEATYRKTAATVTEMGPVMDDPHTTEEISAWFAAGYPAKILTHIGRAQARQLLGLA